MQYIQTDKQIRKQKRRVITAFVSFALVCLLVAVVYPFMHRQIITNGCEALEQTIYSAAMQCCAIEGAYPPSLQYLVDNYGLVINETDYVVTYEVAAENIMPSVVVTVVPR